MNIPHNTILKVNPNRLHNVTLQDIKDIQHLSNNKDIIIRISETNMGLCICNTSWYINEYKRQINCSTYTSLGHFDTNIVTNLITSAKQDINLIFTNNNIPKSADSDFKEITSFLKTKIIKIPSMDILPKVHKLNSPPCPSNESKLKGRPIITPKVGLPPLFLKH